MRDLEIRQAISRQAIIGHDTAWKISDLGAVQFKHDYDRDLLNVIREKAVAMKDERALQRHLNLTFITGADRFIPEINELIHDRARIERLSDLAGAKLEPYPLSIVGSTVTFMGAADKENTVDWHCDGVPVTELIPLQIDEHLQGGELEIYRGDCEIGKTITDEGREIPGRDIITVPHKVGYATLAQFVNIYHRSAPITAGKRITLVLNMRSVEKPLVDDNRMFYLAADNHEDFNWVEEMRKDVRERQLPAYQAHERKRMGLKASQPSVDMAIRTTW
jgi:hypothetical protein